MENVDDRLEQNNSEEVIPSPDAIADYPPKFETKTEKTNVWVRSTFSLALYLLLGYYIFHSFEMLLLLTAIVVFHELGHFFAMKYFNYTDLGIFFIPLLGAYVSGTKREVSQRESAIILLAGPLPGIIVGIIFYLFYKQNPELTLFDISYYRLSLALIILNLINLLPIYPLDGGQLVNRLFMDENGWISKSFTFLSIGFMVWIAFYASAYILLLFPAYILMRMFGDNKLNAVDKKIEEEGINMDVSYEDLPNEDYWKVRNILIHEHPGFRDVTPTPPYSYSLKEEKIMTTIQSLLHRTISNDVSIAGKIFILLIWVGAFASPWLLQMDMSFLRFFGL